MSPGDDLLIIEGDTIRFIGKIALKTINPALSRELWSQQAPATIEGWDLVYFIANPLELNVPFHAFTRMAGFEASFRPRGFMGLAADRLATFYEQYDDLYSVLLRLQHGDPVVRKSIEMPGEPAPLVAVQAEDVEQVLQSSVVSDHVKMQWKLASLGLKAGEKVWVPAGDQVKLRTIYNFNEFELSSLLGLIFLRDTSRTSTWCGRRSSGSMRPSRSRTLPPSIRACCASRT